MSFIPIEINLTQSDAHLLQQPYMIAFVQSLQDEGDDEARFVGKATELSKYDMIANQCHVNVATFIHLHSDATPVTGFLVRLAWNETGNERVLVGMQAIVHFVVRHKSNLVDVSPSSEDIYFVPSTRVYTYIPLTNLLDRGVTPSGCIVDDVH